MKLGIMTGWAAVCLLGMSTLLTPSSVSAGFVIDDFEETYAQGAGDESIRSTQGNITFNDNLIVTESDDGNGGEGGVGTGGGGGGIAPPDELTYQDVSLEGLSSLILTGVSKSGNEEVTIEAYVDRGDGTWYSDIKTAPDVTSDIEFSFSDEGITDVTSISFLFYLPPSDGFSLSSSSLEATFASSSAPQATPEPTSLVLFGLASAGGGLAAWRKRRKQGTPSAVPS